jgi:polysaccharide biosynthesis/export protein
MARARVVGEVIRPATYEVRDSEGLPQLLEAAGGFTSTAARRRVFIERIVPAGERDVAGADRTSIDVSSAALASGLGPSVPIRNGDVVRIFPIAERVHNRIAVTGNVNTPGPQGLTPGMTVADALRAAGGVKSDTYLGEVLVSRLRPDRSRAQLRARLLDTTGTVANDFPLLEDDQIQVFSLTSFRPARYVAIAGHVKKPGRFPYRQGMTVRDLVLLADGVKEGARLTDAEIARLPVDRSNGQTAVTIRVPLDSTYLFDRGRSGPYDGPPGQGAPAGGAPDVALEPYDNVLIFRQENFEYQRNVVLKGEVKFPGTYALKNKREHLRDVILRAGGLTDEAQTDGIVFVRKLNRLNYNGRDLLGDTAITIDSTRADSAVKDTLALERIMKGRVGIDLAEVLRDPKSIDNLVLEDGDQIMIPRFNPVVRVQGAVNAPSNVTYVPGRDLNYYIRSAGGGSRSADKSRAYVTQPSGKLESVRVRWLLPDGVPQPKPGAVVTVPDREPTEKNDFVSLATVFAQVIASLATIVVITRR